MIIKCKQCGCEFKNFPSNKRKFCSRICVAEHMKTVIGPDSPHWKGGGIHKKCKICGKDFVASKADIKYGYGIYCSAKCRCISQSNLVSGSKNYRWKGGGEEKICQICNNHFKTKQHGVNRKFCSYKCYYKYRTTFVREKHWNWMGGVASGRMVIRNSYKYKSWRTEVFNRDKYTCKHCGKVGGYLYVHHIELFSKIIKELCATYPLLKPQDVADHYLPLWKISNGITLCGKCHKLEHKRIKNMEKKELI